MDEEGHTLLEQGGAVALGDEPPRVPPPGAQKAGADEAATGENSVVVACRKADIIVGPIGIVIADSMLGEITPKMALSIAQSPAKRILIPFNHCDNIIAGISDFSTKKLIQEAVQTIQKL